MGGSHDKALIGLLTEGAEKLRAARLPSEIADALEQRAKQVEEPCVLAVVGRAKAGKSTFINALLGDNLAKVGVTETTATINFFRYGNPPDLARPIRCHWRGGRYEDVSREFLDSLQGHDADMLRRADGIEYLEYLLPNPVLRDITLVDTPGTEAAVDEHQNRTAEFLNLQRQLRDRHNQETERWASQADAVIYLIGQVPRATDQALLDEFAHVTGGRARALNAVGVMAKIDFQPELLSRFRELASKAAEKLKESLNTVVPVSAGIRRALDHLQQDGNKRLIRLMTTLRQIPSRRLEKLLDSDELYEMDFEDCPVRVDERRELRGDMPWTVFTTIARLAANPALTGQAIVQQLEEVAGFGPLRDVLERHFFKRDRFLTFIHSAGGEPAVARELAEFVTRQLAPHRAERLEAIRQELDRKLSQLFHDMEEYNADFEALGLLEQHSQLFTSTELNELRPLLGLYGIETAKRLPGNITFEEVVERQHYWADVRLRARNPIRRDVAARAEARYGLVLSEWLPESQEKRD